MSTAIEVVREAELLVPQPESGSEKLMAIIEHMGKNPHVQVETLKELLALKVSFEKEEARKAFHAAMAEFNKNIPVILKNKHVHYIKRDGSVVDYWHESLDSVVDAITGALAAVGISKNWPLVQDGAKITVSCVLTHAWGHSETSATLSASPDDSGNKNSIQAIKSTITYLQRTTLLAATGTAPKGMVQDDDGRAAGGDEPGERLAEHLIVDRLNGIDSCATLVELQRVFGDACKAAGEDKNAVGQFIQARDKRKAEIKASPQAMAQQSAGGHLAEHLVLERLDWVANASGVPELQRIFDNALKMAVQAGDKDFEARLRTAANKRAEAISAGN